MPRYVILYHQTPPGYPRPTHWDFMLESQGVLKTWALPQLPRVGEPVTGEALPDHRIEYLDYQGPVSANRGDVTAWDHGQYALLAEEAGHRWVVQLAGDRLQCTIELTRDPHELAKWCVAVVD